MKKLLVTSMILGAGFLIASNGYAAIAGSAHDFSSDGWTPDSQICIACHTPHHADTAVTDAPLWNHELSTVDPYALYSSATLDATLGQPDGVSKLCLACHDGTVALENFGGATGGTTFVTDDAIIGGGADLSDHHPVSFTYDTALATADGELFDPATSSGVGTDTIQDSMLFNDTLQCASCHDVHNSESLPFLLLISNTGSGLCLTCHDK